MLSTTAEYALRALSRLADESGGDALHGRDIAQEAAVPANYLSKILLVLKRAGIVEANRGSGGGYRLARIPQSVRLLDVVELFDAPRVKPTCLLGSHKQCSDGDSCPAHERWQAVRQSYLEFLETTTLADIAGRFQPSQFSWGQPVF